MPAMMLCCRWIFTVPPAGWPLLPAPTTGPSYSAVRHLPTVTTSGIGAQYHLALSPGQQVKGIVGVCVCLT